MSPSAADATTQPFEVVEISVDGRRLAVRVGTTLLRATLDAGVYIPHLCYHPDLPAAPGATPVEAVFRAGERIANDSKTPDAGFDGCGLCVVQVDGAEEPLLACDLAVSASLAVRTDTPKLKALRQERLASILATHPHACITCAQKDGCSREPCSTNVARSERCCPLLGRCELEKVACYIGIPPQTPRYTPRGLPAINDDPLLSWQPELCVSCLRCVRACTDLKGVGAMGFVYSQGKVIVGLAAPSRLQAGCRYCGACVEVCPTGALTDRVAATGDRASRLVPCRPGCPAGMDVPRLLRSVSQGHLEEAARVSLDRLPLPNSLGRVCFHPCERDCRRSAVGGALSVCRVRRHVFEAIGVPSAWPTRSGIAGPRVAVVGSGPAGLAAAHFLTRLGRQVTVFEAAPEAGGMLRYGIPSYRLPKEVLEGDLELLRTQGIEIRTGMALGRELSVESLREQGFAATLLALGAGAAKRLPVPGADLDQVLLGVNFLRDVASGSFPSAGFADRTVLVIGGGNVAVDAARSAVRLGASSVTLACLEKPEEMPAYAPEIEAARAEGIGILNSWAVGEVFTHAGKLHGARVVRCVSVFDEAGRFAPRLDHDTRRDIRADVVIVAIGQEVERGVFGVGGAALEFGAAGFVAVHPENMTTSVPGIFACGDLCLGPSSVVESVASGRRAALAIDLFLGGSGEIPSLLAPEDPDQWLGEDAEFAARARVAVREIPSGERVQGFCEVEHTLEEPAARVEAGRCLQCDLRLLLSPPTFPPLPWLELSETFVARVPAVDGVYQLLGEDRVAVKIAGTPNLRAALEQELAHGGRPRYFVFEEDPMFTKRESELVQQFLAVHGRMPAGEDGIDDLF